MNRNQRSNNPHQGHGRGQQGGNNYQQQQQYFPDYGQGNQGQGQGQQYQQQFYPPGYQQQYQQPYYPQDYYQQQHQQYGGQYNEYEDYNQQYSENPDQLMLEELEREMGGSGEFVPQQHQQQQHSQQAALKVRVLLATCLMVPCPQLMENSPKMPQNFGSQNVGIVRAVLDISMAANVA